MWIYLLIAYAILVSAVSFLTIYRLHQTVLRSNELDLMHYLKEILSNLHASAVITDDQSAIVYMNDRFLENSGYAPEELLNKNISMLKSTADTDYITSDLWDNLKKGQVWRGPFMNLSKNGDKYIEDFLVFPVRNFDNSQFFCAISYNVANRYLENKKLEQVQRQSMQFKENFISNLSHEVRTPLNALVGLSQLGAKSNDLRKNHSYFNKMNTASKQLMQLMDDILDFSKIESGSFNLVKSRFNFMSLLTSLTSQFGPLAAEKNLEFNFFISDLSPQYLYTDSFRLEQIISNLLSNAIKFTDFGQVSLSLSLKENTASGYQLHLAIKDSGIGMDQVQIKGIFNPFSNLVDDNQKRSNNSSGLGMAITKQIVDLMGGSIYIDSKPQAGTFVEVVLPFDKDDLELSNPHVKTISDSLTVMIIDDFESSRNNAANMLTAFGYEVISVTSGQEAMAFFEKKGVVDLVIIDWHLPDLSQQMTDFNGLLPDVEGEASLFQRISLLDTPPRILYITPFGADSVPENLKRHIHGYLPKPYAASMLFDEILSLFMTQPTDYLTKPNMTGIFADCKVLLVDDNPVNNLIARNMFEHEAARVTTFLSAIKALDHLTKNDFHLIVTDIDMPEMDGFGFLENIQNRQIQIPVFALTANTSDDNRQRMQHAGFKDAITKPLTQFKLRRLYEQYLKIAPAKIPSERSLSPDTIYSAGLSELKLNLTHSETQQLIAHLCQLLSEVKLRKPKGCKEKLSSIKYAFAGYPNFMHILNQFQQELSGYRFDQLIHMIEALITELGGERQNESHGNV